MLGKQGSIHQYNCQRYSVPCRHKCLQIGHKFIFVDGTVVRKQNGIHIRSGHVRRCAQSARVGLKRAERDELAFDLKTVRHLERQGKH